MPKKESTNKKINAVAEKILHALESQKFADWYGEDGKFTSYICGDLPTVTKEEILKEIENLFHV